MQKFLEIITTVCLHQNLNKFLFIMSIFDSRLSRGLGRGLQSLVCWGCGFEYRQRHGYLFFYKCCVLSGRVLCDGLITHPEESYRLWFV